MKILLIISRPVGFILSVVVFAVIGASALSQGRENGVDDLFGEAVLERLSRSDRREMGALLQAARVADRDRRQLARRELVARGRRGETFLLEHFVSRRSPDARCAALVLSRSGGKRTLALLRSRLERRAKGRKSKDGDFELEARALGRLGTREDAALLVRVMRRERSSSGRRAIVHALGLIGDESVLPLLLKEFETGTSRESRCAVLLALAGIGSPRGRTAVQSGLTSHKQSVQVAAILAVASVRHSSLTQLVVKRLASKHAAVVQAAVLTLARIRAASALEVVMKRRFLRHRDAGVRRATALLIGAFAEAKLAPKLRLRLMPLAEEDPSVRRALIFALARCGGPAAHEELREIIQRTGSPESDVALLALGLTKGVLAEEELLPLLQTSSSAALLLAHHFPSTAVAPLKMVLAASSMPEDLRELPIRLIQILEAAPAPPVEILARLNTELEALGGSVEWQHALAVHRVFLETERLHHPLGSHSGAAAASGGAAKPASRWTDVAEDHRLWFDDFPHYPLSRVNPAFN